MCEGSVLRRQERARTPMRRIRVPRAIFVGGVLVGCDG